MRANARKMQAASVAPTERQGAFNMTTLGPYDYWAVEYGYKVVPAEAKYIAYGVAVK